jgi:murein DD-endopeptidase MepM/ murein hydrolase activator NlpD
MQHVTVTLGALAGDFLGTVGDFRPAFPPHLHFAARDGSPVTKINGCSKSG